MGKNTRAQAAARAAEMRAEAARKDRQRKQVIAASVAVVVIIVAVLVGTVIANRPVEPVAEGGGTAALTKLTSIPVATLDAAPAPSPQQAPAKLEGGTALEDNGKPKVLYVGAEFCPFCAMERWALIGALSRFGSFSGLTETSSSSSDAFPDTPTFSFAKSTYTSDYVAFKAVETQDRDGKPLQTLEGDDAALMQKYNPKGTIPWVNYGGTHATNGATVDANAFEGKTYDEIMAGILDPTSPLGKTVAPAINVITAQLCAETDNKPANVCTATGVTAASVLLKK